MTEPQARKKVPFMKLPGKPLPKRLLRPFVVLDHESIDDKRLVRMSMRDRTIVLQTFMVFPYLTAIGGGLVWLASSFREPRALIVAVLALALGGLMHYLSRRLKPRRFVVFDRERGVYREPGGEEYPWSEVGARIGVGGSITGAANHMLYLTYKEDPLYTVDATHSGIDTPLGIWSFLVQYMDKDAPLPDVPQLAGYPNRTSGLGGWKEWEERNKTRYDPDPYYTWLAELDLNPELDEANARIIRARRPRRRTAPRP